MNKIITITLKEMRGAFTDRSLMLIMFAAPLAVATIIAVTFGGVFNSSAPVQDIPVAIVNQDTGANNMNNGAVIARVFLPSSESGNDTVANSCVNSTPQQDGGGISMDELVDAVALDDPTEAKKGVDEGKYAAAVIIPADFTRNLSYSAGNTELQPTQVEVYGDPQRPIAASIIRSIVDGVVTQLATGNIAVAATLDTVSENYGVLRLATISTSQAFQENVACAFASGAAPISVERQNVQGNQMTLNPLVLFGASQAIFFALFTANGFSSGIMEERRNWTLQRLIVSPTSRLQILLGKMNGTFSIVILQLVFLFIGFTLIASLMTGQMVFIWGTNIIGIIVMMVSSAVAATGLGSIVAAASKTPEQAGTIGSILALVMAVFGGSFGFTVGPPLGYFSIIYWGTDGFTKLALGSGDFWLNAIILIAFGVVTFGIGLFIFNRRVSE